MTLLRLVAAAAAFASSSSPRPNLLLLCRPLHSAAAGRRLVVPPPSDAPWLQTDGVVAEGRRLRRLAVGGIGGANMAASDPAQAAGAPSVPLRRIEHAAPATGQQKMATEQDVIAAAEDSPTTAEWMPQRTP